MQLLADIYNPEAFRAQGHALVDLMADYLVSVQTRQDPIVIPWMEPAESLAYWQADSQKPLLDNPIDLFADILANSTHLHHPRYMGHQVPPPAPLAVLAGMLTELLNNGMAVYEMGLASNPMEKQVTELLAKRIGYTNSSGGLLTSGGTLANLTALLTARALHAPSDVWGDGHSERLAVMVSEEAHYCIDRAARIMGLGSNGIIKVPCDPHFKMRTDLLESRYREATEAGLFVFAIVGSACSTATGAHDNLEAIADFAADHQLWFHADGAHGGAAVFSQKYRHLVKGIERADSVVVDFHKMLLTPALATALVYREGKDGFRTFQQKAQYLWADQTSEDWYNSGKRTFECTKYMMSTKVYALLRAYGEKAFEANVDCLYDLGAEFAKLVLSRPNFELAYQPECNIVCFRHRAATDQDANDLNTRLRKRLLETGTFYIVQTNIEGLVWLRVSLMNPLTTTADLVLLLDTLETHVKIMNYE